ncbi:MAG: hypothetical protein J5827_01060 [Oscillospiraceae bacterium]|nr:hypothetical protein [Oscillospiraceae bacterium]
MRYKSIIAVVLFLLWLLFLAAMLLVCFDVFDENAPYFYLIAAGTFLAQIGLLYMIKRITGSTVWMIISEMIYVLLTLLAVVILLKVVYFGLLIFCLCLVVSGTAVCAVLRRSVGKEHRGERCAGG